MKNRFLIASLICCVLNVFGQEKNDLTKLVETEKSFARTAGEKGTREAFLEFLADDGTVFNPTAINGKEFWRARSVSPSLLSWSPAFADVSSNGVLGYTTGDWEFRPKGKDDAPAAFGQFMTIWRKQPDGNYKAVVDLGVSHDKPPKIETDWKTSKDAGSLTAGQPPASSASNLFFDTATTKGLSKAYKIFASENVRLLRGRKFPILGKAAALAEYKKDKRIVAFGKNMTLQNAGDLAYSVTTYELKDALKTVEKGNAVQIWKFSGGKWQIVMDVFSPIPEK